MHTVRLPMIAAIALSFAGDLLAAQRTFVSAASGSDANACTRALPCRNFAAALPQTDANGEVIVLDSGGYGVVTITQPVSLISPRGVYAGITAFSGTAITVNAGDTSHVVLRNLYLNSQGADIGIDADGVAALHVESCVINNFFSHGIQFLAAPNDAQLRVSDSVIRRSHTGIQMVGLIHRGTLNSVRLYDNFQGVRVSGDHVTIRDSLVSGGGNIGFAAEGGANVTIIDSVATKNAFAFGAYGSGIMIIAGCTATSNDNALYAQFAGATIYVSDSTITANQNAIVPIGPAVISSRGNNIVESNTNNGSFTGSFGAN